ncbi:MAG: YajQ family cyclic di-GMP-binding protein [Acidobacteriota bacterium]|nr:YajQ family cyclic di-GMP-binding protein [Acidobacteriota bacterium]
MPSFDIVVQNDLQEVDNAVNQARKEISQRYDFRGSKSSIDWDKEQTFTLVGDDEYKLGAVLDVLKSKLVRRGVSVRNLESGAVEPAADSTVRQKLTLQSGIPMDKAKAIVKSIKGLKLKVQAQIMDDQVRVTGKKRDDLQAVIQHAKGQDVGLELEFVNFRD